MATEEEAREAADGKEVQMEDVDLEPFHMQTRLDSKLSSMEIKNVAESIDSTEGTLKIPEDQVLVDAPSEIKRPLEHNLNGTSSSLNGHMDEENKISNEQLQGDSKKDREQVQAALGGESTDQNNKINKEANDYLNHGETTTEDSSLLKHENKDKEPMPDTLKTNSDIDQSKLVVDQHQLDHNMDPAKATEDTQPASMENIPNAEVVTEARAEVQSPLYPNLDDSNAILDTVDGSTETDEAATGDATHLEHRKRFPEDTSTDKHTEVMAKEEDQQSKQAGAINADAVQEDIPKCEESGVSKEMPKSEHADESMTDAQEVLHQEPSEDTNGLAYEKKEQTSQQSSMAASGDTTSEPPVDIQVQNKKSLEEMKDADAVDTEAAMQERYIAFEEGTPESHVAATEQDSVETNNTESVETHNLKIVPSSEEEKVEHDVTARGSTTSSQEVDNVGSTEAIMDKVAENIVEVTNAATVDEAKKEKNMAGIESEVTKSTEPVDTEEDSDQRYFSLLDNSAQGDDTPVSEKKHTGSALEKNEIEATRTESVTGESKASVSEEPSPQDYVTESEATSDSKEVNTTESSEAIEGDKDIKTREILDQNSMNSAGKSTQENNAPESELTSQIQPEELESEEMKVNELVQVNESSPEISATVFHKEIQENNPATSELHVMESGGMRNIETTEVQVTPHQLNCDHPEEKTTEETITSSEPQTLEPESVKKMNDIEASKPQDISQQSIISPSEKSVPEEIAKEDIVTIESNDGHQQPEDPESAELDEIKTNKSQEIASSSIVFNYEEPTSQDDVTVTEPNSETQAENLLSAEVMEDTENVKGHGALSGEVAKEENVETETIADMSPVQEPELEEAKNTEPVGTEDNITPTELPAERMEKETVEIEAIPYESRVASIRDVAENDILTAITSHADIQPVLKQESVEDKCIDTTEKPRETQQIVSSPSDELIPAENKMAMTEPACETPLQNVIAQGIKDCEDAPTDQISNLDSFPTPGEADQENKLPGIEPTSDDQELGSTEQTIGIKAMETEDHQQHRVFTLEETAVNKKSNVDDHQVHEEKLDNEAMEVESVLEQSNISTPYNPHEDRSELGTDPDCCVEQAEQVESSKDSEESKHLKEEDTSDQKIVTLDDTATEGIVQDEISPPAGMEKEHEPKSLETSDVQEVEELGSIEQTRGVEATETEDHQQYIVSTLEESALDNNPNVDDHQVHEEKPAELKDNEAMEAEPVLEQSNISTPDNAPAQQVESSKDSEESKHLKEEETSDQTIITLEDKNTEDIVKDEIDLPVGMKQEHKQKTLETSDVQEVQDLGSIEETRGIEATETEDHQQHRFSTLAEPEVDKKPNVDDHQVHEEKPAELIDNGAMEAEPVLEQSNISTTDNPPEERSERGTDPYCCVQPAQQVESSKDSEESKRLNEEETSDQEIITLEDTTTEDIVQDEINPPADMEQEHEPKSLETSDVQEVQELDSIEETRGVEATEIKDHQQHRVSTLEESAVDKPNVDDHQVHEEKPAELKDNEAMEAEPVLEQSNISTPDNAPAQQVESSKDSEESKHLKEEETSDQTIITLEDTATKDTVKDEIDLPVGMEQEHERKSLETSDVQEVQDLGSIEQNRGTEATETEDHQQHRVSTLEEPAVDKKPNVDDHQVHDEKPAELKDNEAMEAEPVLEQSNISTSDNAPEERSELGTDPDCCVHPAQQVESSRDSEDSKLLKEEETSDQKIITLEDTGTVGIVEDEFDPPVSMEQEHEQKSVEEVKDINANEAKEDFHTNQPDALDKLASESNTATAEPTYDIQHLDDFETKETKSIEGIDDGDISCQQAGVATSVDPSPTDNEIAPQEHPVESHEENLGNETENEMLDRGMKEEIHRSAEPKDDAFHLGETIPTTKKSKNLADEDVIQSSGEDTLESSNGTDQIKGGKKAGIEHNSSQKPSEHHGENITHVQDKDINRESVTERGTTEISQALIGNDAQASQDVTEEDGTTKSGEQTNDHRQAGDVEHRPQTCESSVDDEDVQKVSFDERHKEDEEVETQKEQLQADEQKHKDESDDASNEPLVESKNTNNGTTNRTRETDMLEAGQSLCTSEDSTPSITNTPVEDITGTDKGVEDENWPNSTNTSDADAKMEKQEDQENTGKDNIVPMDSTRGQDETTDEITNEELEPSLASCVQDISHTSPSKDHILENDPTAVPYNVGSGGHEDKECTNKVNDDLPAIQELEKEIVTGMQENKEMQNETKGAHHVESHTKAEVEDMFQLHSNEPYNVDTKIDDTVHNTTVQPRETEEIGENKGFSSIYKPVVETSEQNNVEQDLSIQHKDQVEDEKLESSEDNAVEMEATQQKVDTSNVDISNDDQLSTSNALTKHETESADDVLQLETEGNTFELCEKTEASNTSVLETVTLTEEICDKVTEVEGGLSDKSLKTFDDARRNLDVSSVVRETNEESMNEDMEENKLAAPEHPTMDETTPKQQISVSEKPLPIEPEEPDDQIHKKQDEKDMYEPNFGDDQKEVEQDLPVSNFLMNLILGKENSNANGHSEPEAETKQEETRDDNSCSIIPKQEESLVLPPTENNMECKLTVEQEQKDVKCPEEKYEVVKEQSNDLKLGTETSLETDAEFNKNSHHLELPPYQDKMQDEISNEILSKEPAEAFAKIEAKDLAIPSIIQDDKEVDNVCQENTEAATQNEIRSIKNNLDDFKNTKISEEDTPGEGETGLLPECLNEARSVNSVSEQTLLLTDSGMTDAKSLPSPNPVCEIQDKTIESSSIGATIIPDIQVESEEDKIEKKQPTTTATGDVAEEHVEISNDNPQKSIGPETTSNEQEPQIAQQVNDTEIVLGHEKKILAGSSSTFMDKKEDSNFSVKEGNNIQTAVEIQADGPNMQVNQDKQKAADIKNETESEKLKESNIQEKQGNDTEEKSPKECHEEDQQFLVKEIGVKEEDVHQKVQSHTETVKIKANDEQKISDSEVQERDFNVFSPKDVREPDESFVDTANPECRTDEEQSPKADESNISEQKTYEGKTKDEEKIKSFTDEEMKTEAQVTGEKAAHKKQNLLSGVGSKVKHQLAKVKKAITGKPGHTKPKSPKA